MRSTRASLLSLLLVAPVVLTHPDGHYLRRRGLINENELSSSYDYIIAGGGNAGLVLASRLSEKSGTTVLVLEAGPTGDQPEVARKIDVPGNNYYDSLWNSSYDWSYNTEPQAALENRSVYWPRGRVLGGTTATNAMFFVRPSETEINAWESVIAPQDKNTARNWGWDSLYNAMKKSETFHEPSSDIQKLSTVKFSAGSHGRSGPIHAAYPPYQPSIMSTWIPTLEAAGVPSAPDADGGSNLGGFITPNTINPANWTRSYAVSGYINPLPPRSNLHILTNATVTKIVFDGNKRATGVEWAVSRDSPKKTVNVNREVLLSAGVVGSPQILMLSGVGPKNVLDAAKIPVVAELEGVGQHIQEHLSAILTFDSRNETTGDIQASGSEFSKTPEFLSFVNSGIAYVNLTTLFRDGSSNPKAFLDGVKSFIDRNLNDLVPSSDAGVREGYKTTTSATAKFLEEGVGAMELVYAVTWRKIVQLQASSQHPFSHGRLYINTNSAFDKPVIDPKYLSHSSDIILLRQAAKLLRSIAATEPLRSILGNETDPGPQVQTDEQWESWIRRVSASQFHPLGSCAMLPRDKGGVVDSALRVYGLAGNVRVIDSSVYPMELSAHLAAPTYGLAEIASTIILGTSPNGNSATSRTRVCIPGFSTSCVPLDLGSKDGR